MFKGQLLDSCLQKQPSNLHLFSFYVSLSTTSSRLDNYYNPFSPRTLMKQDSLIVVVQLNAPTGLEKHIRTTQLELCSGQAQ